MTDHVIINKKVWFLGIAYFLTFFVCLMLRIFWLGPNVWMPLTLSAVGVGVFIMFIREQQRLQKVQREIIAEADDIFRKESHGPDR